MELTEDIENAICSWVTIFAFDLLRLSQVLNLKKVRTSVAYPSARHRPPEDRRNCRRCSDLLRPILQGRLVWNLPWFRGDRRIPKVLPFNWQLESNRPSHRRLFVQTPRKHVQPGSRRGPSCQRRQVWAFQRSDYNFQHHAATVQGKVGDHPCPGPEWELQVCLGRSWVWSLKSDSKWDFLWGRAQSKRQRTSSKIRWVWNPVRYHAKRNSTAQNRPEVKIFPLPFEC